MFLCELFSLTNYFNTQNTHTPHTHTHYLSLSFSRLDSIIPTLSIRRSIKNRRKAERKKHSLREGSANEDLALMEALTETVNTVDRLQDEVASLLGMLVQYGFTEEGRNVQRTFECLLSTVKSKMDTIWSPRRAEQPLSDLSIIVVIKALSIIITVYFCCYKWWRKYSPPLQSAFSIPHALSLPPHCLSYTLLSLPHLPTPLHVEYMYVHVPVAFVVHDH